MKLKEMTRIALCTALTAVFAQIIIPLPFTPVPITCAIIAVMGKRSHHTVYGKGPGWQWIKQRFLPRLLDEGFSQQTLDKFMIENPARFYTMYK